jgi:hypothetical protein
LGNAPGSTIGSTRCRRRSGGNRPRLVDAVQQQARHLGHPRFGVAHRGRVIAVDVAEIALAVDQRIALREILREPDQRVIDRLIAVRMVFADDVADHARRLLERLAGIEPQLPHGEQQPPVHRFEPIARVGSARCMMVESA